MTIENSRFLLVKVGSGLSPETFANLGAQSDGRISMNAQRIPTSNKTTQNWNSAIGGLRDFVVTVSGFADWPDTAGLQTLMDEAIAGNDFNIQAVFNSAGDMFAATVQATGLEIDGANQNATQYNTTLELSQGTPVLTQ